MSISVVKNKYKCNTGCSNLHPNLLWCKLLYAVDWWPSEHDGNFLHKNEYSEVLKQKASKYESALADLRFLEYIEYIAKNKSKNYGYKITALGKQVLQQLKDEFGEENLLIF